MNSRILIRTISKSALRARNMNANGSVQRVCISVRMLEIDESHSHDPVANITEPFGSQPNAGQLDGR
jgi:hypothetical protein